MQREDLVQLLKEGHEQNDITKCSREGDILRLGSTERYLSLQAACYPVNGTPNVHENVPPPGEDFSASSALALVQPPAILAST